MSTIESTLKKQPKVLKAFLDGRVFEEMAYGSPNICNDDEIFDAVTSLGIRTSCIAERDAQNLRRFALE